MKHQAIVAVTLISFWACGDSSSPTAGTPAPPAPAPPTIQTLRITAPSSLEVGQTAQLSAVTVLSNGTTQTVATSSVRWQLSNFVVATISTTGVLLARQAGVVDVRGTYQQWTSDAVSVTVTSSGGYYY
jgi:hypothetical protein